MIMEIREKEASELAYESELDIRVTELLLQLGISASTRGYTYLRVAIMQAYQEPESAVYVTKTLYPLVARKCNATNSASVERTCHHSIARAFNRGYREEFVNILGISASKCPTCSEFIRGVASCLRELDKIDIL